MRQIPNPKSLFHKQNSPGKNPYCRRGAWPRGEGACVKRGLVGSNPAVIILNFTHNLPVCPDSRARAGRGVYSHALPPSTPHGQRTNYPSTRHVGRHGARLTKCISLDPRSSFTWERHRLLLGAASDGVYPCLPNSDGVCPCLPKWVILIWAMPG